MTSDYFDRALNAYFRTNPNADQPSEAVSDWWSDNKGRWFISLRNSYGELARYRLKNDRLRRVKLPE